MRAALTGMHGAAPGHWGVWGCGLLSLWLFCYLCSRPDPHYGHAHARAGQPHKLRGVVNKGRALAGLVFPRVVGWPVGLVLARGRYSLGFGEALIPLHRAAPLPPRMPSSEAVSCIMIATRCAWGVRGWVVWCLFAHGGFGHSRARVRNILLCERGKL